MPASVHGAGAWVLNLSEDFTYVDVEGGFAKDRAAYIDFVMKMPKVVEASNSDVAVKVHGTTAVATGRVSGKTEKNESFATRYTDTLVKGPDGS